MAGQKAKGGKKNRKHGRNKKSPAMQRYVAEGRLAKNKARKVAKEKARQA
jgi:hypothetical protein